MERVVLNASASAGAGVPWLIPRLLRQYENCAVGNFFPSSTANGWLEPLVKHHSIRSFSVNGYRSLSYVCTDETSRSVARRTFLGCFASKSAKCLSLTPANAQISCAKNLYDHCRHPAACARTGDVKPFSVTSPMSSNERPLPRHSSAIAVETRICSGCA